jgi:hypothetical protein
MRNFVICINNETNPASLILGKAYPALPDAEAEEHNMIRIIDDDISESDGYLYDASMFVRIEAGNSTAGAGGTSSGVGCQGGFCTGDYC